mgnify:CR=1 FL=1
MNTMRNVIAVAAVSLTLGITGARAEEKPLTFITTAELISKVSAAKSSWNFTVIDARSRTEFEEGHIYGAINIPAEETTKKLPGIEKDKFRELIFYCNGVKCTKSKKGGGAARALGYTNILEYNEGMPAWGRTDQKIIGVPLPAYEAPAVTPAELAAALKDSPSAIVMLDLRPVDEFAKFHVKGALNVPLDDIKSRIGEIPRKPIVVVDHAGHQTLIAGKLLKSLGREGVKRLGGGLLAWKEAGISLEEAATAAKP